MHRTRIGFLRCSPRHEGEDARRADVATVALRHSCPPENGTAAGGKAAEQRRRRIGRPIGVHGPRARRTYIRSRKTHKQLLLIAKELREAETLELSNMHARSLEVVVRRKDNLHEKYDAAQEAAEMAAHFARLCAHGMRWLANASARRSILPCSERL